MSFFTKPKPEAEHHDLYSSIKDESDSPDWENEDNSHDEMYKFKKSAHLSKEYEQYLAQEKDNYLTKKESLFKPEPME
jgi:hypothetical protein